MNSKSMSFVFALIATVFLFAGIGLGQCSESLTITTEGNVGIGTDTPQAKLDVAGAILGAGGIISSNRSAVGLEYNVLFNATNRYTVTQSGVSLDLGMLFDGRMAPSYSSSAPSEANPYVLTISGLPGNRIMLGSWIGWSTRYRPPKRFKIEGYDMDATSWVTLADYSGTDYTQFQFITKVPGAGSLRFSDLKLTVTAASGTDGKLGLSEIFYIQPEATRPYAGLLPTTLWEKDGNVGIGISTPAYKLQVAGSAHIDNTLTAGSKQFKIDHPLAPTEKVLYHTAIEAPRNDLIYRGKVQLQGGKAMVDIDAASNLTPGTFAALTQNGAVVSLQNQDGFDRVRPWCHQRRNV